MTSTSDEIRELAIKLCAVDNAMDDDFANEEALRRARGWWNSFTLEPWLSGHSGDCTKEAHTCVRCVCEDYEVRATRLLELL